MDDCKIFATIPYKTILIDILCETHNVDAKKFFHSVRTMIQQQDRVMKTKVACATT